MKFVLSVLIALLFSVVSLADTFFCPMKCEGAKTYPVEGHCPVCGMNLEKVNEGEKARALNTPDYRLELTLAPDFVKLTPRRTKDNSVVPQYETTNAVLVSQDLSYFAKPELKNAEGGGFGFKADFPNPGNYILYAGFVPTGERDQVFPLAIQIPGKRPAEKPLKGEAKGTLRTEPAKIKATFPTKLFFSLPKATLHTEAFFISEDTTQFIRAHRHAHQRGSKEYIAVFPKGGKYKGWFPTSAGTSSFVVDVAP